MKEKDTDVPGDGTRPDPGAGPAPAEPLTGAEALESRVAEAEQKAAEHWDKYLRASAELENVRRRLEREAAQLHKYALEGLLGDLIGVQDSLELGLKAAGENPDPRTVLEGLELTHKQFWAALERHGLSIVDPRGQPFDPDLHEAVAMVESEAVPANHVVEVMQKGYRLHDRLLRPARVVVARAPQDDRG